MRDVNRSSAASRLEAKAMVDLDRYPIEDLRLAEGMAFAARCRSAYVDTGLCVLPGFVRMAALEHLAKEAHGLVDKAYFCKSTHNAYLTTDEAVLPSGDVRRRQEETYVGSIAYDLIPQHADLRRLYQWEPLRAFIAAVLGKSSLHRFADPFGACSINVFRDGGEHGWHFDESEFTVTLMLRPPEHGGAFEYVPKIRGLAEEREIVGRILDGDRKGVIDLPFTPGALLIFGGRQTLHRVTRVSGATPRLVPVLCYSEQPGQTNSAQVRQLFWGRPGPQAKLQP